MMSSVNVSSEHTDTTLSQFPVALFALEKKFKVLSIRDKLHVVL